MTMHSVMRRTSIFVALFASATQAAPIVYVGKLSGAQEVPANASAGSGAVEVRLDGAAHTMLVSVVFSGLTGTVTAAHIHCCIAPGQNAGVATTTPSFPGFPSGVTAGTYTQTFDTTLATTYNPAFVTSNGSTAGAETALANGMAGALTYFNIHSTVFPGGEIRAQLRPAVLFSDSFEDNPA